jgi:uncharacterized Zn-finger protein
MGQPELSKFKTILRFRKVVSQSGEARWTLEMREAIAEAELNIDPKSCRTFKGKEDQKEDAEVCPGCATPFRSGHLEEHLQPACGEPSRCPAKVLERMEGRPYKCDVCPKGYKAEVWLRQHMDSVHRQLKPFQCATCDKCFTTRGSLSVHTKTKHEGLRVVCEDPACSKTFAQASQMHSHYRVLHLKMKRFECTTCGITFSRKVNLARHMNIIHLRLLPFACQVGECGKVFGEKNKVNQHHKTDHLNTVPSPTPV